MCSSDSCNRVSPDLVILTEMLHTVLCCKRGLNATTHVSGNLKPLHWQQYLGLCWTRHQTAAGDRWLSEPAYLEWMSGTGVEADLAWSIMLGC